MPASNTSHNLHTKLKSDCRRHALACPTYACLPARALHSLPTAHDPAHPSPALDNDRSPTVRTDGYVVNSPGEWTGSVMEWTDSIGRPSPNSTTTGSVGGKTAQWPSFSLLSWGGRAQDDEEKTVGNATAFGAVGSVGALWQRVVGSSDRNANSGLSDSGQRALRWRMFGLNARDSALDENTAEGEAAPRATKLMSDTALRQAFDAFDADSSGSIDREEMAMMVTKLGLPLSARQIDELMSEADADDNVRERTEGPLQYS